MLRYYGGQINFERVSNQQKLMEAVQLQGAAGQTIGLVSEAGFELAIFSNPSSNLPVGTLQPFLDQWCKDCGAEKIDYVHGEEPVLRFGRQPGNLGIILPAMKKSDLFKTVILDGALPRKTFSMGEAKEKRFYMEARQIA